MKKLLRPITLIVALVCFLSASAAETVLAEADFSTLTGGSEETPEIFKYSFDFSGFSGWSIVSGKTGAAGGSLYIGDGGNLKRSSISDVSTTGGAIKVSALVKLNKATAGIVQLKYGYSTTQQIIVESADWQTVEFFVQPTSSSSFSNSVTLEPIWLADGIFVKNIKVAQSPEFIAPPIVNQPSDANGTAFTASWKAVTGATKYFVDVYSYDASNAKVMFIENKECSGTSLSVTGLDPATTYYYVVRAANDTAVSGNSEEIEVVKKIDSLDAPVVKINSCDEAGNFSASWEAVADADSYSVAVFKSVKLTEAGEANILAEDFNAFTQGSFSSVEYIYDRHLEVLNEPGWSGYNMACIDGAIGITPYGSDANLVTPSLNLSDDEGKIKIVVTMCSNNLGSFMTGDIVKFAAIDAEDKELSSSDVTIDKSGFAEYTVNLTGGTTATKIKISSTSSNKIFIDNIEVKQLKPAGFNTTATYLTDDTEGTEYSGKVEFDGKAEYSLVVTANGRTVVGAQIAGISSNPSEAAVIAASSGIEGIGADSAEAIVIAKTGAGRIAVSTPAATTVEVYDMAGRIVTSVAIPEGTTTVDTGVTGLAIVKAGATTAKLAL